MLNIQRLRMDKNNTSEYLFNHQVVDAPAPGVLNDLWINRRQEDKWF